MLIGLSPPPSWWLELCGPWQCGRQDCARLRILMPRILLAASLLAFAPASHMLGPFLRRPWGQCRLRRLSRHGMFFFECAKYSLCGFLVSFFSIALAQIQRTSLCGCCGIAHPPNRCQTHAGLCHAASHRRRRRVSLVSLKRCSSRFIIPLRRSHCMLYVSSSQRQGRKRRGYQCPGFPVCVHG